MIFFIGFVFGSIFGMFLTSLCIASAQADRED